MTKLVRPDDYPLKPEELAQEFDRTGFPKSSLAALLGIHPSLVTRLVSDRLAWIGKCRLWKPGEAAAARALFALVPKGIDDLFRSSVASLRRSDRLAKAVTALAEYPDLHADFGIDLGPAPFDLRVDQVVYLCRVGKIDITELAMNLRVTPETDESRLTKFDPNDGLNYERASLKALRRNHSIVTRSAGQGAWHALGKEMNLVAEGRSDALAKNGQRSDTGARTLLLPAAPLNVSLLDECLAFVVSDESLEPRYRKGETILASPPRSGHQSGDDILVRTTNKDSVIGRFLFERSGRIVIDHPRDGQISVGRHEIQSIHRISFVVR